MLKGCMVALVTPMNNDGSIDFPSLNGLVDFHLESGTDALVILGSTGEASTITPSEKEEITKAVLKKVNGKIPVIVGTSEQGTEKTIELTRKMASLGVDACLIAPPPYIKPTQEGLKAHFSKIAQLVDIPIILYNHPGRTASDLSPELVGVLCQEPNIVAIKEASGFIERVAEIKKIAGNEFPVFSGDDPMNLDMIKHGADGVISVTANVAPKLVKEMVTLALAQDFSKADQVESKLAKLNEHLFVESNPIPIKWALYKLKYIEKGIRLPLLPLSSKYDADMSGALERVL